MSPNIFIAHSEHTPWQLMVSEGMALRTRRQSHGNFEEKQISHQTSSHRELLLSAELTC